VKPGRLRPQAAYLAINVYEGLIALSAMVGALVFFADPGSLRSSSLGQVVHPYDTLWNALYLLGGAFIVAGLLLGHRVAALPFRVRGVQGYALEFAGLIAITFAITVNTIASISIVGLAPGTFLLVAAIASGIVRCYVLTHATRLPAGG
jgi:hypothetical protein